MRFIRTLALLLVALLLWACDRPNLPLELPEEAPGLPSLLEMPGVLRDLGISDLGGLANLPEIADLPALDVGPNSVAFTGPIERSIAVGEWIPGTDIELVGISEEGAEFQIAGMRSVRVGGDSLDYDGPWLGANGLDYNLRLRIYRVGARNVRAAGVQRLVVHDIQPVEQEVSLQGTTIRVPYTGSAGVNEGLKGLTYGYAGQHERGAEVTGLATDVYPYHKTGDSIRWEGLLRPDLPIEYNLRVLYYNDSMLQVGGVATLELPGQ